MNNVIIALTGTLLKTLTLEILNFSKIYGPLIQNLNQTPISIKLENFNFICKNVHFRTFDDVIVTVKVI